MNEPLPPSDDRSSTAKAFEKASHLTAISLMGVIPAIIGFYLDGRTGTGPLLTLLGLVFGMAASVWQLIQFVKKL